MSSIQPAQSGFADIGDGRLYYEVAGEGYPLVLSHEGIGDSRMYDDQFGVFAERYRTTRYDLRGFGRSTVPSAPFSYVEDLHALLRFLGVERAHLLGMSMGGGLTIDFALTHPEMVSSLVLAGSALGGYEGTDVTNDPTAQAFQAAAQAGDLQRLTELAMQVWLAGEGRTVDQLSPALVERVRELVRHQLELGADESLAQPLDPPAAGRLGEIHVPTLVIVGDRDLPDLRRIADLLETRIPGARKVVMRNTAHVPNMEYPAEFNALVLDFLASVPTG